MPRIVDPRAQRADIRRAAWEVFARRGVAGTGLAHVAQAAGMGRSSLYHYYPDRGALVRDLARELLDGEGALFARARSGSGAPLERIDRLCRELVGLFEPWMAVGRNLFDPRSLRSAGFRRFFRRARRDLAAVIREGQESGDVDGALDPETTAALFIGTVDGLLLQIFVEPSAFPDRDALVAALTHAVRGVLRP